MSCKHIWEYYFSNSYYITDNRVVKIKTRYKQCKRCLEVKIKLPGKDHWVKLSEQSQKQFSKLIFNGIIKVDKKEGEKE